MLSYDEAVQRILDSVKPLPAERVVATKALGRTLAEPIVAPESLPSFDNSAVDGYAVRREDIKEGNIGSFPFPISQWIAAGDGDGIVPLVPGTVARIFTGAMLPPGADAILMQEDTETPSENTVILLDTPSPKFIRRAGSDVQQGETILHAGQEIGAGAIGLLSALGITEVACHRLPRVGILSTGNELVPIDTPTLAPGKIRDSNGYALEAAVVMAGGVVAARLHADDDADALRAAIRSLGDCDVIISSGGVSVGGADLVKDILTELGTLDFWRIAIKPGKPLAFGRVGEALFFGLPGNPVSSLVTFELFVRPVLRRLAGHLVVSRPRSIAVLTEALPHEVGRREFVRVRITHHEGETFATPTGAQGSHRIASLLGVDALLVAHEDHGDYEVGAQLPVLLLS